MPEISTSYFFLFLVFFGFFGFWFLFYVLGFGLGDFRFLGFLGVLLWGFLILFFGFCSCLVLVFCDFDCCCILYSTSLSSYVQPDDGHHYGRNM